MPSFRSGEFVNAVLIGGLDLGVGNFDFIKEHLRINAADPGAAERRRVITRLHLIKPGRQRRPVRGRNGFGVHRNGHKFRRAAFEFMRGHRARDGIRQRCAGGNGVDDLRPAKCRFDLVQIFRFAHSGIREDADEPGLRKIAKLVLEGGLVRHRIALHVARDRDSKLLCLGAEHHVAGESAGDFGKQTGLHGLADGGVRQIAAAGAVEFHGHFTRRQAFIAGRNGLVAAADQAGRHVADTPERETAGQEDQKNLHDWRLGAAA